MTLGYLWARGWIAARISEGDTRTPLPAPPEPWRRSPPKMTLASIPRLGRWWAAGVARAFLRHAR